TRWRFVEWYALRPPLHCALSSAPSVRCRRCLPVSAIPFIGTPCAEKPPVIRLDVARRHEPDHGRNTAVHSASAILLARSRRGAANAIDMWPANLAQCGMVVNYVGVGSTVGRVDFKQGEVNWAASEIPYGVQDGTNFGPTPSNGYTYMPDTAGAVGFMYNLTISGRRVTDLRLSGNAIAGIFTGVITNWDDPIIAQDNPGLTLPDLRIVPVVRTDGSGATAQFTQWMLATEGSYWTAYCAKVGRNPCTQTSAYPVLPGMVGQPGDLGVAGYVCQPQAE